MGGLVARLDLIWSCDSLNNSCWCMALEKMRKRTELFVIYDTFMNDLNISKKFK